MNLRPEHLLGASQGSFDSAEDICVTDYAPKHGKGPEQLFYKKSLLDKIRSLNDFELATFLAQRDATNLDNYAESGFSLQPGLFCGEE